MWPETGTGEHPEEFTLTCHACQERQVWSTRIAAQAALAWHIHDQHHDLYAALLGAGAPHSLRPEAFGRRVDAFVLPVRSG